MKILTEKKFEDRLKAVHAAGKAEAKAYYDDQLRVTKNSYDRELEYLRINNELALEKYKVEQTTPEHRLKEVHGGWVVQKRKIKDNAPVRSYGNSVEYLRKVSVKVQAAYDTVILEDGEWKVFRDYGQALDALRIEANPRIVDYAE